MWRAGQNTRPRRYTMKYLFVYLEVLIFKCRYRIYIYTYIYIYCILYVMYNHVIISHWIRCRRSPNPMIPPVHRSHRGRGNGAIFPRFLAQEHVPLVYKELQPLGSLGRQGEGRQREGRHKWETLGVDHWRSYAIYHFTSILIYLIILCHFIPFYASSISLEKRSGILLRIGWRNDWEETMAVCDTSKCLPGSFGESVGFAHFHTWKTFLVRTNGRLLDFYVWNPEVSSMNGLSNLSSHLSSQLISLKSDIPRKWT
jgi:hypothetical protein